MKKLSLNKKKVAQLNDAQLESLQGGLAIIGCSCSCPASDGCSNSCNSCINCTPKSTN